MQLRMFYILIFSLKQIDAIFHSVDNQFESIESIEVTSTLPPPPFPDFLGGYITIPSLFLSNIWMFVL